MKELLTKSSDKTRRRFMTHAASSLLGVGLTPALTGSLSAAGDNASPLQQVASAKRVIYLYMSGGMTHLDTLDVKPGHENQGPVKPINTTGDYQISEYLPMLAKHGNKMAVVNSMNSKTGAHQQARYLAHTSYEMRGTIRHPALGSWLLQFQGKLNPTLPGNVVIGNGSRHPGAGFFPQSVGPLMMGAPDRGLQNVAAKMEEDDFEFRTGLSRKLGQEFASRYDYKGVRSYGEAYDDALKLMDSADLTAFDIKLESQSVRDAYGDNQFGQGCLLARRLIENDVRFVEVSLGGWDTHGQNFVRVPDRCADLDRGMATLITDLEERGLLDDTIVVLATEFGRTPRINQNVGRDHFPKAFSAALIGGGIKSQKYGKSSESGEEVVENLVRHADLNATIGYGLGLPLNHVLYSPSKRPFTIAQNGQPVTKLFS
ncbi:MAG: hypothetical protein ACI8UO_003184 [Verrucomicrobiales bacterium]|jgi:hypothetical protein